MAQTAVQMKSQLSSLPAKDWAKLARFLILSLDVALDEDAETAWDAELGKRANEIKSGKCVCEPADKVFKKLRAKHS